MYDKGPVFIPSVFADTTGSRTREVDVVFFIIKNAIILP